MTEAVIRVYIYKEHVATFKATDPILPRQGDIYVFNSSDKQGHNLRVQGVLVCHGINTDTEHDYGDEHRVTYTSVDIYCTPISDFKM